MDDKSDPNGPRWKCSCGACDVLIAALQGSAKCLVCGDKYEPDPVQKHATVNIGEYTVPLIGIAPAATKEICSKCGKEVHLSQITFNEMGEPECRDCG